MKERQRWRSEEDAVLRAYVKQYGPHEWSLVSQRMGVAFDRDAKSCLERWKNYLKPGLKKGSLTEEEQCLVIRLQAKHGNKWKKIAAEVPGRTAKRLGKWWEVFKEKQRRELEEASSKTLAEPIDQARYDHILENFAEKLVKDRRTPSLYMAAPLLQQQPPGSPLRCRHRRRRRPLLLLRLPPPSPSPSRPPLCRRTAAAHPWPRRCRRRRRLPAVGRLGARRALPGGRRRPPGVGVPPEGSGLAAQAGRAAAGAGEGLQEEGEDTGDRVQGQGPPEEQAAAVEKIEAEFRDQLSALRRDAELKEQKLAEQWAAKHLQLARLLDQMMGPLRRPSPDTAGP
ncbi:unnamed protein product [Spirodela intermedia]|uniref:Uncharacterized protein n=1 Tax=Spirodela intermedia TaxID=51605 RepID=A0A7I8IBA1_SPIIN|nr:unnamed protein product [Spirodela intermedia]CAA6654979.1 unnamed protein product [Spirodela intermedia]